MHEGACMSKCEGRVAAELISYLPTPDFAAVIIMMSMMMITTVTKLNGDSDDDNG